VDGAILKNTNPFNDKGLRLKIVIIIVAGIIILAAIAGKMMSNSVILAKENIDTSLISLWLS